MSEEVSSADALLRENAELREQYLAAITANADVAILNATLQSDLLDRESELRAAEAQLAELRAQLAAEHARMAALLEACEAVAAFVESYDRNSSVARLLPTFYANLRVYGKNARAAVAACRGQADALLSELHAARAVVALARIAVARSGIDADDRALMGAIEAYDRATKEQSI